MSDGQKLLMLKIHLSLDNLKAATEENMQQRRLIKDLGESLGPYRFGEFKF